MHLRIVHPQVPQAERCAWRRANDAVRRSPVQDIHCQLSVLALDEVQIGAIRFCSPCAKCAMSSDVNIAPRPSGLGIDVASAVHLHGGGLHHGLELLDGRVTPGACMHQSTDHISPWAIAAVCCSCMFERPVLGRL